MHPTVRIPVVVLAPSQLVVANRTSMKSFLLAQLGLGADVVLDLSETVTLDSSGLGMLISVDKSFRLAERSFVLCGLHDELSALFEVTQVDRRIRIAPNVERARAMLSLPPLSDAVVPMTPQLLMVRR